MFNAASVETLSMATENLTVTSGPVHVPEASAGRIAKRMVGGTVVVVGGAEEVSGGAADVTGTAEDVVGVTAEVVGGAEETLGLAGAVPGFVEETVGFASVVAGAVDDSAAGSIKEVVGIGVREEAPGWSDLHEGRSSKTNNRQQST